MTYNNFYHFAFVFRKKYLPNDVVLCVSWWYIYMHEQTCYWAAKWRNPKSTMQFHSTSIYVLTAANKSMYWSYQHTLAQVINPAQCSVILNTSMGCLQQTSTCQVLYTDRSMTVSKIDQPKYNVHKAICTNKHPMII